MNPNSASTRHTLSDLSLRDSQQGATLIIVLIFLILIMAIGVVAVRQSSTDLKVATADQVDLLLLNSADSAHAHVEQGVNDEDSKEYVDLVSAKGALGYFMNVSGEENRGDQLIFCYDPRESKFFSIKLSTVLTPSGGTKIVGGSGNDGYCDVSEKGSYTSDRATAMTQVMITRPDSSSTPQNPFDGLAQNRDAAIGQPNSTQPTFEMYAASVLPAMSNSTDAKLNDCFTKPSVDPERYKDGSDTAFDDTLSGCMQSEGVPNKVIIENAQLRNTANADLCIGFGKGTGTLSAECQEKYKRNADGTPKAL